MATVTFFDPDLTDRVAGTANYTELTRRLDLMLPSENSFYAIMINGHFPYMKARSVPAQEKPYPRLVDAVSRQRSLSSTG